MVKIQNLIQKNGIIIDLKSTNKFEAISDIARFMCRVNGLANADEVADMIVEREMQMSTGIGYGIAIPHARLLGVDRLYMAAARSAAGIEFEALDGAAVNLIFMLISPANTSTDHTQALSRLSSIMSHEEIRLELAQAGTPEQFLDILVRAENRYGGAPRQ
ncbi:MAG: PTS sugar transporter subunit IIA [Chitinispirillales bacterium]|jgi:PTS system fructose-specific IIC component|nr:PTS sugar transporter subunit IIA [Chitinispirillales bacterium]